MILQLNFIIDNCDTLGQSERLKITGRMKKQDPMGLRNRSENHTQMILFLNQNEHEHEHDSFSSVSQGNFQDRESLFHSFRISKPNHSY